MLDDFCAVGFSMKFCSGPARLKNGYVFELLQQMHIYTLSAVLVLCTKWKITV